MLLGTDSHHEGWDVDELFTHSNMSLSDQHSGVMDGVRKLSLGNQGLESSFHELTQGQTEDVIELLFVLLQESKLDDSLDESVSLEGSSGIGLVQGHELSGSLSHLGEGKLDSPHLSLASETVSSDGSELVNKSVPIEWFSRGL